MRYLITGATGYIGARLALALAGRGHTVHALYRSAAKTGELKGISGIALFKGDILEPDSLKKAAEGCDGVFHVAALAKVWDKDPQAFYRFNVEGALNVFEAARQAGAGRIVFTSTAGVISPPGNAGPSDEKTPRTLDFFTEYERSKGAAEAAAARLVQEGMDIVTVNPTRVYGPGLLSDSNGVTKMIKLYLEGKYRLLPGDGSSVGNYVYVDDVVRGHLAAMQRGQQGERYILGGENASFTSFFHQLGEVCGKKRGLVKIPIPLLHGVARVMELRAMLTGAPPLLTPPWVKKYLYDWELSVAKARQELGIEPMPLRQGLQKTVEWIRCQES